MTRPARLLFSWRVLGAMLVIGLLLSAFTNVVDNVVGYLIGHRVPISTDLWGWLTR